MGNYNSAGTVSTGHFHNTTKVLVAQSVMDIDAFAWCADWYRKVVKADKEAQGQSLDDHFRIWYTDHAQHTGGGGASTRTVGYRGTLEQGLLDLEAWAERGEAPPASSAYQIVDNKALLAPTAAERHGIQPLVHLTVNGSVRANIDVGDTVTFDTTIEVPPGSVDTLPGVVTAAERGSTATEAAPPRGIL